MPSETQNQVAFPSENDMISTSNAYFVKSNLDAVFSAEVDRVEASPHIKQFG